VQRDHPELIELSHAAARAGWAAAVLNQCPAFSSGSGARTALAGQDISAQTLPFDFERNPRIHRCFEISTAPNIAQGQAPARVR